MNRLKKAMLINFGILAGLALEFYRGSPPKIIALTGMLLLLFANLVMYVSAKKRRLGR